MIYFPTLFIISILFAEELLEPFVIDLENIQIPKKEIDKKSFYCVTILLR
jgi:hypothetical protein